MKSMQENRKTYVDLFKGIGIILMVMGHVGFGNRFDMLIHAFNMPMFFLASGFCFKGKEKFIQFLKKKIKTLIVPYFMFSFITYIVLRKNNNIEFTWFFKHVFWQNNVNTPIAGVWFLTALFWANLIYFGIKKIRNTNIQWMLVVFMALLGMTIENTMSVILPYSISSGLVGIGVMHIGKILAEENRLYICANKNKESLVMIGGGHNSSRFYPF